MNLWIWGFDNIWDGPILPVRVTIIFSVKSYPLHTNDCPLHLLAFSWTISQQEKWRRRWKGDRFFFVSVCSAAELDPCVVVIYPIRKCPVLSVYVIIVFIVPTYVSWFQICGAGAVFLVNTVFTWRFIITMIIYIAPKSKKL